MSRYTSDARWVRVRNRKLRQQPACERCGKPATDVHHIDGQGLTGPDRYNIANTESLCHSCHAKETAATTYGGFRTPPRRRPNDQPHPGLVDPAEAA